MNFKKRMTSLFLVILITLTQTIKVEAIQFAKLENINFDCNIYYENSTITTEALFSGNYNNIDYVNIYLRNNDTGKTSWIILSEKENDTIKGTSRVDFETGNWEIVFVEYGSNNGDYIRILSDKPGYEFLKEASFHVKQEIKMTNIKIDKSEYILNEEIYFEVDFNQDVYDLDYVFLFYKKYDSYETEAFMLTRQHGNKFVGLFDLDIEESYWKLYQVGYGKYNEVPTYKTPNDYGYDFISNADFWLLDSPILIDLSISDNNLYSGDTLKVDASFRGDGSNLESVFIFLINSNSGDRIVLSLHKQWGNKYTNSFYLDEDFKEGNWKVDSVYYKNNGKDAITRTPYDKGYDFLSNFKFSVKKDPDVTRVYLNSYNFKIMDKITLNAELKGNTSSVNKVYLMFNSPSHENSLMLGLTEKHEKLFSDSFYATENLIGNWTLSNIIFQTNDGRYISKDNYDEGYEFIPNIKFTIIQPVKGIFVNKDETHLLTGETDTIIATVLPNDAFNKDVIWTSSDENVASVNSNGTILAIGPGDAIITVTTVDGNFSTDIEVNVTQVVEGITINSDNLDLYIGDSETLEANIKPSNASNKNVLWSSSDENVATVDEYGRVTALSIGETVVTVTSIDGNFSANIIINVRQQVQSITVNKDKVNLLTGETDTIIATVLPNEAYNKDVIWTSSDETIASVGSNGTILAIGPGDAIITVTTVDGNFSTNIEVNVTQVVEGISINNDNLDLYIGDSETLEANIKPSNASNKNVLWSSSDENVATVDEFGRVTAITKGIATITATTIDGNYSAEVTITINDTLEPMPDVLFNDVPVTNSFYHYVVDLYADGIINGYDDGSFRPNNSLTRAQAAVMIVRAAGISTDGASSNFKDVSSTHNTYKFISAAYEVGIINGYSDGTFKPNDNVTRAQIATMVARAFNLKKEGTPPKFVDVERLSSAGLREYIYTLSSLDIVKGYGDEFRPNNNVTRGQFSKMVSIARDPDKYKE